MDKLIIKTDVELNNGVIVDCFCINGFALAVEQSDEERKFSFCLSYPTLEDILKDKDMCHEVLTYCGLWDLTDKDIHYGDIMLTHNEIVKPNKDKLTELLDIVFEQLKEDNLSDNNKKLLNMVYPIIGCILFNMNC